MTSKSNFPYGSEQLQRYLKEYRTLYRRSAVYKEINRDVDDEFLVKMAILIAISHEKEYLSLYGKLSRDGISQEYKMSL